MALFPTGPVNRAIGLVFLVILAGCAGKGTSQSREAPSAESQLADPNQALNELANGIQEAQARHVDLLSPKNFAKAKESFNDAQRTRSESKDAYDPEIIKKTQEGQAYLNQALKTARISSESLAQANEARQKALDAGAQQAFPEDFKDADEDFISASEEIEKGNVRGTTEDERKLVASFNELERRALREKYTAESARVIQSAKNEGAEKWAPKTLRQAQTDLNHLDVAIKQNPRDVANLERLANNVRNEADFLLKTTRESKTLEVTQPEERALDMARMKDEITASQAAAMRDKEQQMASAQELQQTQKQLESSKRLETLAKTFTPEEAEVLRKGNQIVIHLKALEFQKSKVQLQSSNYALLNKLGEVVAQAGPDAKVTVQGNTDSTGSASRNQKISEQRAEAVKDYLVSNKSIESEKIQSRGVGFSKPIASNKTAEGRRLNRRVDIIIEEAATS